MLPILLTAISGAWELPISKPLTREPSHYKKHECYDPENQKSKSQHFHFMGWSRRQVWTVSHV